MTKAFIVGMKEKLEQDRERLLKELEALGFKNPQTEKKDGEPGAAYVTFDEDLEDNASEIAQYSDNISVEGELEKSLRDVEKAIKRIVNNLYGVCIYCKMPIEEARLEARPETSSCIKCKKTFTKET